MTIDDDICYRALSTRDRRFDGGFFTGVRSTGVFCRPICPAPTPKRENCTFFPSAAAAHAAGFRPCLRCRPEAAPGTPAWAGTSATVSRAMRLIEAGALDEGNLPALCERLGVGERHLRRLFLTHVGATPTALAQMRRALFAKKLLDETGLTMTEIAYAAGYASVRRFNEAFQRTYGRPPTAIRRSKRNMAEGGTIALRLPFRPPYAWSALLDHLGPRAIPGVETVSGGRYRRTIAIGATTGTVEIGMGESGDHLTARLRLSTSVPLIRVVERLKRQFDLGADPAAIATHLGGDARLGPAVAAMPGLRVTGAWDPFELAVRAILGQQISVAAATTLAGRMASAFGRQVESADDALSHLFPTPEALADADLTTIGVIRARSETIMRLARAVAEGTLILDGRGSLDEKIAALCEIPGIGPWTASYVAMRGLGEPDAFPEGDLGLRRAFGGAAPASAGALREAAEAWRPWRAYAAMYLWRSGTSLGEPESSTRHQPLAVGATNEAGL